MKEKHQLMILVAVAVTAVILVLYINPFNARITFQTTDTTIENPFAWVTANVDLDNELLQDYTRLALSAHGSYDGHITITDVYTIQKRVASDYRYADENPKTLDEIIQSKIANCYNKALLIYCMILHEDPTTNTYILLSNVVEEETLISTYHASVVTIFPSGIIISDATINAWAIRDICYLAVPEDAIDSIVDETNLQAYHITGAVSLDNYYIFADNQAFFDWAYNQMRM